MINMRRFRQQLPEDEVFKILIRATNGVLSLIDVEGHPYGVPLSFVYDGDNSIYFHCALTGRKIDCIRNNPSACFTIVDQDEIQPEKFTTFFRSVVVEGKIKILDDRQEMIDSLRLLSKKYSPGIDCESEIEKGLGRVLVLKLEIASAIGKEAIELTAARNHN